jgi:Double-GTPase 1
MSGARTVAMLGLPRTGKSTYLGALWRLVQDTEVSDIWEVDFTGDRSYINALADNVSNGIEIERTAVDTEDGFELEVGFAGGHGARLDIPDLSGEATRELVEERVWRKSLATTVERASALMLFVHPDKIDLPVPANFAGADEPEVEAEERDDVEFHVQDACTAAKLIELLENVIDLRPELWPIRIAVIVSAWDRVDGDPNPPDWLEERLPGVSGVLACNSDQVNAAVYGVSAQGGRLPHDRDALLAKGGVRQRVFGRRPSGDPAGLWDPLRWALGLDE